MGLVMQMGSCRMTDILTKGHCCAVHELTAEHMDVMLDFFEKNAALDESPMHVRHPFVAVEARVVGEKADLDTHPPKYHPHSHAHALGEWFVARALGGKGG